MGRPVPTGFNSQGNAMNQSQQIIILLEKIIDPEKITNRKSIRALGFELDDVVISENPKRLEWLKVYNAAGDTGDIRWMFDGTQKKLLLWTGPFEHKTMIGKMGFNNTSQGVVIPWPKRNKDNVKIVVWSTSDNMEEVEEVVDFFKSNRLVRSASSTFFKM